MSYNPAKRATEFIFYVGLRAQATGDLKIDPTIASGDFKVIKDGGASANLSTLPSVSPAGSSAVKVTLSSTEMTADNVYVQWIDAAGAEWYGSAVNIQPSVRQIDDLTFPNVSGRGIDVDASGGVEATLDSTQRNAVADSLLDRADAIETGLTPRGAMRLGAASDAGKASGGGTTTFELRNAVADTKARITATVTAVGDRTAVTTDVT